MIRAIKQFGSYETWEIDGVLINLLLRSNTALKIAEYKQILQNKSYENDNSGLCEMFRYFGGVPFMKIGMIYEKDFLLCFYYYAKIFAEKWAAGEQHFQSTYIGCHHVFQIMLDKINYSFPQILYHTPGGVKLSELANKAIEEYWTHEIEGLMRKNQPLTDVAYRVGDVRVSRYMMLIPDKTKDYITELAHNYTQRRELINLTEIYNYIFGNNNRSGFYGKNKDLHLLTKAVVDNEFTIQFKKFIAENYVSMDIRLDKWILYQSYGLSLKYITIDFTQVTQTSLLHEVKYFIRNRFSGTVRTDDGILRFITQAVNRICANNASIQYFADIDLVDVKALQMSMEADGISLSNIKSVFTACRIMMDYLCGGERDKDINAPIPRHNHFHDITFVNISSYFENTPYIPDTVLARLEKYSDELCETNLLVFRILNETGMRAKEVIFLRDDCLKKARYDGYTELKYIPYKTLIARRLIGLSDYHSVYISNELAAEISIQIKKSKELRNKCGLPYIFLHKNNIGRGVSMWNRQYFIDKINNLITKYDICDDSGMLWHFTSRQCRKTIAVNMIENGARIEELAYQLGHLAYRTATEYYAEVRKKKLLEMNTEFFRKKFEIDIESKQLGGFTEEERKLLYVDMCLGYRCVEFGFCIKKSCGVCHHADIMRHCVTCPNLCTGKQYLPHWQRLLDSEEGTLKKILDMYSSENITDYSEFIEFKQQRTLVSAYQDIVDRLNGKEGGGA